MPDNVKYGLLIYNEGSATTEHNIEFKRGQTQIFQLFIGHIYRWIAYSINDNDVVPNMVADPCTHVYPQNRCRMPTKSEFTQLPSSYNSYIIDRGESISGLDLIILQIAQGKYIELVNQMENINDLASASPYSNNYRSHDPISKMHNLYFGGIGYYDRYRGVLGIGLYDSMYERPRLSASAGVSVIDLAALALASNLSGSGYYRLGKVPQE